MVIPGGSRLPGPLIPGSRMPQEAVQTQIVKGKGGVFSSSHAATGLQDYDTTKKLVPLLRTRPDGATASFYYHSTNSRLNNNHQTSVVLAAYYDDYFHEYYNY